MKNKHGLKIVLSIASIGIMFVGLYQFAFASTFGSFQSDQSTKMSNSSSIIQTTPSLVQTSAITKKEITFTAAELAQYNGMNGNPAYVAVEGIIYDMTKIGAWKNGQHQGLSAGQDLTTFFASSPHSASLLNQVPIVGKVGGTIGSNPVDTTTSATTSNSNSNSNDNAYDDEDYDDDDEDEDAYDDEDKDKDEDEDEHEDDEDEQEDGDD